METPKLFVGNLDYNVTTEEINDLFAPFGTVKNIRLRQSKGWAFVEMATPEEAIAIIAQFDQQLFKDRPLRVSLELPKKKANAITRQRRRESAKKKSVKKKMQ